MSAAMSSAAHYVEQGQTLVAQARYQEAIDSYLHALDLAPHIAVVHFVLGFAYYKLGDFVRAIACQRSCVAIERIENANKNLAVYLKQNNQIEEAILAWQAAREDDPNDASLIFEEGQCHMQIGNYAIGLAMLEQRWHYHRQGKPEILNQWCGQDLQGKTIHVFGEQGIGDEIMYLRYIPQLKARGAAHIYVSVYATLAPMVRLMPSVSDVFAAGEDLPPKELAERDQCLRACDYACAFGSLAYGFKTTIDTIPCSFPYLQTSLEVTARWQAEFVNFPLAASQLKVGLVWSGNPNQDDDWKRSIPLAIFQKLLSVPNCIFLSLQNQVRDYEAALFRQLVSERRMLNTAPHLTDYAQTAAIMQQCDVIISVCTSTAHMAGALAKPVWVLLPFAADWRWHMDRLDSPWYPSATLFRASERRDWQELMDRVHVALTKASLAFEQH